MAKEILWVRNAVSKKKPANPFYILLLFAGVAFAITACAYGVMTVRQLQQGRMARRITADVPAGGESFNELVDRHGPTVMIAELILLGLGTFGAIAYDQRLDLAEAGERTERAHENDHTEKEKETST